MRSLKLKLVVLLLLPNPVFADCLAELDRKIEEGAKNGTFSGTARITRGGKEVWSHAAGFTDHNQRDNAHRLYGYHFLDIGSIGKSLTAAAILMMHKEQGLRLDATLVQLFPEKKKFLEGDKGRTTVLDLVTMRSGLLNEHDDPSLETDLSAYWGKDKRKQFYEHFLERVKFDARRRDQEMYYYNNSNYIILAAIIDKYSGSPWEQYIREKLLNGKAPDGSTIKCTPNDDSLEAGYRTYGSAGGQNVPRPSGESTPKTFMRGGGEISCSAEGLAQWEDALMGGRIFQGDLLSKYFHLTGEDSRYKKGPATYAFGWVQGHGESLLQNYGHRGPGFCSGTALDTSTQSSIVVLSNTEEENTMRAVVDYFKAHAGECVTPPTR